MTDEQRNEFPATALIDTHVKILDVAEAGDDLLEAIADLVDMGLGGDDPAIVFDSSGTRHLGGALTDRRPDHGLAPTRPRATRRRGLGLHR